MSDPSIPLKLPSVKLANRQLFWFGLYKIPLLFICQPKVIALNHDNTIIRIKTVWLTRNHLNSMYFGALAVGADTAGGLYAFMAGTHSKLKVSLVFKDFQAEFLRRPEDDVYFICSENQIVAAQMAACLKSGERVTKTVEVRAYDNELGRGAPLALFRLGLSLKVKKG
jgi:hypothetical protein